MTSDKTALGDRMKAFEATQRAVLPRRTYTVLRADGRAFHSYLRGAEKPYDRQFMADMDHVAVRLCEEISGAVFAYVQSDEISVLISDFGSSNTEPWFGGVVQKMVSVSAASATVALISRRGLDRMPTFDARVFTIADPVEVANYFIWRQRDAVRNSIAMAGQSEFSAASLHGVNTGQIQEMLWAKRGINWDAYPDGCKRGRVVVKKSGEREVTFTHKRTEQEQTITAMRTWWETPAAPMFNLNPGEFLASTIPAMPRLAEATS